MRLLLKDLFGSGGSFRLHLLLKFRELLLNHIKLILFAP